MKRKRRKYISLRTELAAALCQLVGEDGHRLVSHDDAKKKTARQIRAMFHRDHYPIAVHDGGGDHHWNLTWRLKASHIEKTKRDVRQFAKDRAIRNTEAEHRRRMQRKGKQRTTEGQRRVKAVGHFLAWKRRQDRKRAREWVANRLRNKPTRWPKRGFTAGR